MAGKTEADLKKMIADIRKGSASCGAPEKATIEAELAKTRSEISPAYRVGEGHELVLIVTRLDGDKTLTWTLTVQGAERGRWLTTYGMAFVQDKDEKYFSQATGDKEFTITKQQDLNGLKPLPSVFFTWLPHSRQDRNLVVGPTGGFGLEGGLRPAIFGGLGFTYNWNLGLVLGVAAVPETRLSGEHTDGQKISENLTPESLQSTTVRARFFIAGTFRFGSNPFASSGAATESGATDKKTDTKTK